MTLVYATLKLPISMGMITGTSIQLSLTHCFRETYLKQAKSLSITAQWDRERLTTLSAFLNVEPPHKDLYEFKGTLTIAPKGTVIGNPLAQGGSDADQILSLDGRQLLMRVRLHTSDIPHLLPLGCKN